MAGIAPDEPGCEVTDDLNSGFVRSARVRLADTVDTLVSCDLDQWYIAIGKVDQVRVDRRDFHGWTSPQQEDMMLVLKPEDQLTTCCSKSVFLSPVRTAWKSHLRAANDAITCSINASQHRQRLDHTLNNHYLATALAECSAVAAGSYCWERRATIDTPSLPGQLFAIEGA